MGIAHDACDLAIVGGGLAGAVAQRRERDLPFGQVGAQTGEPVALLEQDRHDEAAKWLDAAEQTFERFESPSLLAAAWIAQGDLALARTDSDTAAELFRRAAESLQDFNF